MFEVTFVEYFGAKWNWELLNCQIFVEIKRISKENPFEKLLLYQLWIFCLNWPLPSIILFTLPWVLLWGSSFYAKTHFVCSVILLTWLYHRLEGIYFYRQTHNGFRDRIFVHTNCLYRVQCRNMRICLHIGQAGLFLITQLNFNSFISSGQLPPCSRRQTPRNTFHVNFIISIYFYENFIHDPFSPYSQNLSISLIFHHQIF